MCRMGGIHTRAHGDDADAARLAMALEELRLGEQLWHEVRKDGISMFASLPHLLSRAVQHLGVSQRLRHDISAPSLLTSDHWSPIAYESSQPDETC